MIANLKNFTGGISVAADPVGNVVDVGCGCGYQEKPNGSVARFHPRYHHFKGATPALIQSMYLR